MKIKYILLKKLPQILTISCVCCVAYLCLSPRTRLKNNSDTLRKTSYTRRHDGNTSINLRHLLELNILFSHYFFYKRNKQRNLCANHQLIFNSWIRKQIP